MANVQIHAFRSDGEMSPGAAAALAGYFDVDAAVQDYLTLNPPAGVVDATTGGKGVLRLSGDLGGTAETPTVPGKVDKAATTVKAYDYGVRAGTGTAQNEALHDAFAAAHAAPGAATVELPPGVITISGTFPLAGYSSGIRGAGGGAINTGGVGRSGTLLRCINQTGAVLDFTDYLWPSDMMGRVVFEGFTVQGDYTTDATKVKRGIYSPPDINNAPVCYTFRDITIRHTGGAGIEMSDTYFGTWQNVVIGEPQGAVANDVPYAKVTRGNGMTYLNVGLRSQVYADMAVHPGDVGVSGAFILDAGSDLTHIYTRGSVIGCWAENLHVPSGGTIVSSGTMNVSHYDWAFFDCFKVKDGTGTSYIRFPAVPPSGAGLGRQGGNSVHGVIEGRTAYHAANPKVWIDAGVHDSQGGNRIQGTKGWGGYNVLLDAGVQYTTVHLMGGERLTDVPGWIDNSGNTTNTLIDAARGVWQLGVGTSGSSPLPLPGVPGHTAYIAGRYYGPEISGQPTVARASGFASIMPFWVRGALSIDRIGCTVSVSAADSSVRLGIYASTSTNQPGALIVDAGTVDSTTPGYKELTISEALAPGVYWLAVVPQGGAPTLTGIGSNSMPPAASTDPAVPLANFYFATGVTGTLPAIWTSVSAGLGGTRVVVRAS